MFNIMSCFSSLKPSSIKSTYPWLKYPDLLKSLTAYTIAFLFLIVPLGRQLIVADVRYLVLLPASILWNDTGKSVGAMIKSTLLFCFSVTACTTLSWFLLAIVQPYSVALVMIFFLIAVAGLSVLKARYKEVWMISANVGTSLLILQITNGHYDYSLTGVVSTARLFSYYRVYLTGAFISLLCNLFIFPRWASQELRHGLVKGLEDVQSLLSLVTKSIVESSSDITHLTHNRVGARKEHRGPHTSPSLCYFRMSSDERLKRQTELKAALAKCRSGFSRISKALEESRLEVAYFEYDPAVYESLTGLVRRMLRHLSLIGTASLILLAYDGGEPYSSTVTDSSGSSAASSRASLFSSWSYAPPHENSLLIRWIAVMIGPLQNLSAQCLREIDQILTLLDPRERALFMVHGISVQVETETQTQTPNRAETDTAVDVESMPLLGGEPSAGICSRRPRPSFSDRLTRVDAHPTNMFDSMIEEAPDSLTLAIDAFQSHLALFLSSTLHAPEGSDSHPMASFSQTRLDQMHLESSDTEESAHASQESTFTIDPPSVLEQGLFIYSYNLGIAQFASTLSLWRNIEHLRALGKSSKRKFYVPFLTRIRRFFRPSPTVLQDEDFVERSNPRLRPSSGNGTKRAVQDSYQASVSTGVGRGARVSTTTAVETVRERQTLASLLHALRLSCIMGAMHRLLEHMTISILNLTSAIRSMRDFQYGLRLAFVVTFWTLFGMFDDTRDMFHAWRGQWAVITIAVVMTPTVGSSFSLGLYRFLGTLLGGLWACFCWTLFASDAQETLSEKICLTLAALFWALPCLAVRQHPKMRRLGTVSLMAFTIVLCGAYVQKLTQDSDEPDWKLPFPLTFPASNDLPLLSIYMIAFQRCTMISLGVLLSIIFTALLFPSFARTALRADLGTLIHQMGYLYHLLFKSSAVDKSILTPTQVKEFWIPFEFQLQSLLIQASSWMSACESEWFLQLEGSPDDPPGFHKVFIKSLGPLERKDAYDKMLELWQRVLDRLLMMRLLISHIQSSVTHENDTTSESTSASALKGISRQQSIESNGAFECLVSEIRISFYHLASSLYAKLPCPPPSSLELKKANWYKDLFLSFQEHASSGEEPYLSPSSASSKTNASLWSQLALASVSQDLISLESLSAAVLGRIE